MTWIDWIIVVIPVAIIGAVAWRLRIYTRSVADFMSASRVAGRYLVCNAQGETSMAVISAVAWFELINQAGFTVSWWQKLSGPLGLFLALTGFVLFRYRQTRCMTMAQFFEVRYSKGFRVFAGFLGFLSGLINYGIFPAVGAMFFVYFCGLPTSVGVFGLGVPTYALIMALYLGVSLFMTLTGGQLTVMVTDCLEGLISMVLYLVVIAVLLYMFSWSQIADVMSVAPEGQSLLDPFDTAKAKDFNIWYVLIGLFGTVYCYMTWQGGHAFNSCAASPHEAKMGGILGRWRGTGKNVMYALLAVCAYAYLRHPDFATGAGEVKAALDNISDPQIRTQMTTPLAISNMLPVGVKGILCALFFFGLIACDGSYLHSWGSILIQDVIVPLRKSPLSQKAHLLCLRLAIMGVAAFGFFFSLFFHQTEYILMFFALTGAIFLGGAGAAWLGGLYWKKGTAAGAWTAMLTGSLLAFGGLGVQQPILWNCAHSLFDKLMGAIPILHSIGFLHEAVIEFPAKFPINGQIMLFIAMVASALLYIIVSLLTCKEDFNIDRMLHRGKYAPTDDPSAAVPYTLTWGAIVGFDKHFTRGDKIISWSVFVWSMGWFLVFLIITIWNIFDRWPISWWANYWHVELIAVPLVVTLVTTVWFTWGGITDLLKLFVALRVARRDERDDGTVVGHHNLDENGGSDSKPAAAPAPHGNHSPQERKEPEAKIGILPEEVIP